MVSYSHWHRGTQYKATRRNALTMERKIEEVIVLYQDSSNPISYWADMSKYKDKAEN